MKNKPLSSLSSTPDIPSDSTSLIRYWAIVPAAGNGSRFGADKPKQYLPVSGKTILRHTLEKLHNIPWLESIVVAVQPNDQYFDQKDYSDLKRLRITEGGSSRAESVYLGLESIKDSIADNDWVLVHDAVRPCVSIKDIENLKASLTVQDDGGILASPVRETVKRVNAENKILETVDRSDLWLAATPQQCKIVLLHDSLSRAFERNGTVTDESSAMEMSGYSMKVVQGSADNIKITHPEDLALAKLILESQIDDHDVYKEGA